MSEIGDLHLLKKYIKSLVTRINENPCSEDVEILRKHVEMLSHKVYQTGLVVDELTGKKYFISLGSVKGGGPLHSKASEVKDHKPTNLCKSGADAFDTVSKELDFLNKNRFRTETGNRTSQIIIQNLSSYPLIYKDAGTYSGYFFSDPILAFQTSSIVNGTKEENTISALNGVGGIFHTKTSDTACSSAGFFSFTVPAKGKNYVVHIGFSSSYRGACCAGIQISGEFCSTDKHDNEADHELDPTGSLSRDDMYNLMIKSYHKNTSLKYDQTEERSTSFKVTCKFTNVSWNEFHIKVEDVSTPYNNDSCQS